MVDIKELFRKLSSVCSEFIIKIPQKPLIWREVSQEINQSRGSLFFQSLSLEAITKDNNTGVLFLVIRTIIFEEWNFAPLTKDKIELRLPLELSDTCTKGKSVKKIFF